jgi:hypothetical protein
VTAISSPDAYVSTPPFSFADAPPRPGLALDYFFMRRRTTTIGEQFWSVAAKGWAGFNSIERMRCARLFSRYRSYWTPDIFSREDRAFYDSLADEFTVFRGQNGLEIAAGGAFTLSSHVAQSYALGRRNVRYSDPTVISLPVMKKDVALVFAARGADEIVLFPLQGNAVRLEATHPARVTH